MASWWVLFSSYPKIGGKTKAEGDREGEHAWDVPRVLPSLRGRGASLWGKVPGRRPEASGEARNRKGLQGRGLVSESGR